MAAAPAGARGRGAASPDEAVAAFGDGEDVTVFGGGTILTRVAHGRLCPRRALLIDRAGLDGVHARAAGRRSAR